MKYTALILFLLMSCVMAMAQGFNQKTNELQLDFKKGIPTTASLPVISWVSPKFEYMASQEHRIEVEANITSTIPLKSALFIVGDNTTKEELFMKQVELTNNRELHIVQPVNLLDGSPFIRIRVENIDGAIISDTRSVVIGLDAIALSIDRKDYALLFATDKYDYWDDLVNPIEDARTIGRELEEKYGFMVEIIENADQNEVFEKLREYNERKFKPQDQLLVFFAGHGSFDETFGEGYVVAKNSLANDRAKTSYISHNRLRGIINNIPCEHILLTMDVCFGGTLDPVIARNRSLSEYETSTNEMVARKLSQRTRKYLTSGGKEYVSDGIPGKHSPFAAKLIESLRSYGGSDRVLTLQEIITSMEVLKQVPRTGSFGDDEKLSDFVFISKQN
jgi:hypothetical protein